MYRLGELKVKTKETQHSKSYVIDIPAFSHQLNPFTHTFFISKLLSYSITNRGQTSPFNLTNFPVTSFTIPFIPERRIRLYKYYDKYI